MSVIGFLPACQMFFSLEKKLRKGRVPIFEGGSRLPKISWYIGVQVPVHNVRRGTDTKMDH